MKTPFILETPCKYKTKRLKAVHKGEHPVTHRQREVKGFKQSALRNVTILLIGAGGLGGEIGEGLARKGYGHIKICDGDVVELSNLNRQKFGINDLYKNKAVSFARILANIATCDSIIEGFPFYFQKAVEKFDLSCNIVICAPDNEKTRVFVSKHYYKRNIPVVFVGVTPDCDHAYVFVQEPDKACFCCLFPDVFNDKGEAEKCVNPAVIDPYKTIAGFTLYAVDTLIMPRLGRNWNYKGIYLSNMEDNQCYIKRVPNCQLCYK